MPESVPVAEDGVEIRITRGNRFVDGKGLDLGGLQEVVRERNDLYVVCLQFLQGFRVLGIVPGRENDIAGQGCQFHGRLILLGQFVPGFEIDLEFAVRARFPPRGIVVVLGHLVKAHLQIVVGSDPIRGVDGTGLKCLEDLSARQDLHRGSQPIEHLTTEAGNPYLQSHNVIQTNGFRD